jgi:predicted nucleic acid-binding protein
MADPASGPFLFDTSAESWLARSEQPTIRAWMRAYRLRYPVHISAVTVLERVKGYGLLWRRSTAEGRTLIEASRVDYLSALGKVWPLDAAAAVVAAEIMAMLPDPPTPAKKSHKLAESRQERLVRWRFDIMIAATALVAPLSLIHNNAADFEAIRGAIEVSPQRFPGLGPLGLIRCTSLLHPV